MGKLTTHNRGLPAMVAVLATLLAFIPHRAYACTCSPAGTPSDELAIMGAVFAGQATNV